MFIMKSEVEKDQSEIIDDIKYILYSGVSEDIGIIHIIDLDADETVDLIKYPSIKRAILAYNETIDILN